LICSSNFTNNNNDDDDDNNNKTQTLHSATKLTFNEIPLMFMFHVD